MMKSSNMTTESKMLKSLLEARGIRAMKLEKD